MVPIEKNPVDLDLIAELARNHRDVERLFALLARPPCADRQHLIEQTIIALMRHSTAEEQFLYPLARDVLDDGATIANHELAWHAALSGDLQRLELRAPDSVDVELALQAVTSTVRDHIRQQDAALFPPLRRACAPKELHDLGERLRETRRRTPTPPAADPTARRSTNRVDPPLAGLVDRIRKAVPHDRRGENPRSVASRANRERHPMITTILIILAAILVIAGVVSLIRRQWILGIVLIVLGLLVGPGGASIFG